MIGVATDVPPNTFQPPSLLNESYTATPVAGSASAETSATVRFLQPVSACQVGFGSKLAHPEPAPSRADADQADSLQPRALLAGTSDVPPTAVTYGDAAGYSTQ